MVTTLKLMPTSPVLLGKAGPVWVVSGMCPEHL